MSNIVIIFDSLVNGQRQQMADQIDEYGLSDFWPDFKDYLAAYYNIPRDPIEDTMWDYFTDAVISYHRIRAR